MKKKRTLRLISLTILVLTLSACSMYDCVIDNIDTDTSTETQEKTILDLGGGG